MKPRLEVVGAAVVHNGRVLVALRAANMSTPNVWEFPGGKVESGESHAQALVREIQEELSMTIQCGPSLGTVDTEHIQLTVYACLWTNGTPTPHEHARVQWVGPDQLDVLDWAEADRPLLPALRECLATDDWCTLS